MRIRDRFSRLLKPSGKGRARAQRPTRFARLEHLEPRYALTAPVALDDNAFIDFASVPQSGEIQALTNDTDVDTSQGLLTIGEINGVTVSAAVGTPVTSTLAHGTLTLSADHTIFSYLPANNFTGTQQFTYKASDGVDLSNLATVSVQVHPKTFADVPASINEGDGLHLDDLNNSVSGTFAPGPVTYYWYVDPNGLNDPNAATDPFSGSYVPPAAGLLNPGGSSTATLDPTWADLNAAGILGGQNNQAIVTLQVVDANGQSAQASQFMAVSDVPLMIDSMTIAAASSGCGGTSMTITATFSEVNPLDRTHPFSATIDWDALGVDPASTLGTIVDNDDGTFTVTATHAYISTGYFLPRLTVTDLTDGDAGQSFLTNGVVDPDLDFFGPLFVNVTGTTGSGTPTPSIDDAPAAGLEGTQITVHGGATGGCGPVTLAWSVTKDGNSFTPDSAADGSSFSFTPDDNATYVVSLSANGGVPTTATINVSNVAPAVAPISGPVQGVTEQTLSFASSVADPGTADTQTYHWQVVNSASVVVAATDSGPNFSFTPAASDTYTVNLSVTDDDGAASGTVSQAVAVTPTLLQGSTLYVGGTAGDDSFLIKPTVNAGEYKVTLNSVSLGSFSPTAIQVFGGGQAGDSLRLDGDSATNSFEVHSGSLVLNGLSVTGSGIATRTIDALGSADTITVYGGAATVNGGGGADSLVADPSLGSSNWLLAGPPTAGTLSGAGVQVAFSSIQHLTGSGTDSLTGPGANNVWQLTGASSGTLGGASFSGFSDLHGGTASDTFRVTEGATFAGSIDGAGGIDKLDYAAFAGGVNVNLAAGSATGFAGGVSGIENVSGGEGDDVIRGDDNANIIAGRGGNDILLGGGGNDTLSGGTGRDFLIGGTGADLIVGNAQEDILVAGTTAYDGNDAALAAIMAEWNSGDTYAIRVANITVGTNVAGGFYLNGSDGAGQTVFTDSDVDTLTGSGGSDWFFANQTADNGGPLDIVTDLAGSEIWSDTDF